MIVRTTQWTNDRGEVVQVEATILADWWEPLVSMPRNVGPFDDVAQIAASALEDCLAWYRVHGEQPTLWDGAGAP